MANVRTPKRRKLSDLYVVGKEIIFDDGSGEEPVAVWISKISPIEQRNAVDAAASERARVLLFKRLPEDDATRLRFRDQLAEMDGENRDTLVEFLISAKMYEAELSAESRLGAEEPWSKDDYLKGLQDLWVKEMKERYYRDEEDKEAAQVYGELKKFADEVQEAVADEKDSLKSQYEDTPLVELQEKTIDRLIETEADFAWMNEFRRQQVFYATRTPEDHRVRFFEDRSEVDEIQDEVFERLLTEFTQLTVEVMEGKDSQETPSSSEESQ